MITVKMPKVLLITNIPTPYRIPLFNVLHTELRERAMAFKVIFGALGYPRRQWRIDMKDCVFPYDVLPTAHLRFSDPERSSFTYSGLCRTIEQEQPGVIVTNGFSIGTTKLWFRSLNRSTPYIIWSGAIGSGPREHWLRRLHRKLLIKRATGFVTYGSRARDYLLELGALPEQINIGINTVDTAFFGQQNQDKNDCQKERQIKRLLFIGDLVPRKGVDRLLKVVQLLARERHDFILDIVGSGNEQPKLEQMVQELSIKQWVNFIGFKQKQDLPHYLSRASCFVFPTYFDIWGLVLVEAMAAGLPCMASLDAGATHDLIQNGQTGLAVDFSDAAGVTEKLNWVLDHPAECNRMGQQARNFIEERVTIKKTAEGFITAIERALDIKMTRSAV